MTESILGYQDPFLSIENPNYEPQVINFVNSAEVEVLLERYNELLSKKENGEELGQWEELVLYHAGVRINQEKLGTTSEVTSNNNQSILGEKDWLLDSANQEKATENNSNLDDSNKALGLTAAEIRANLLKENYRDLENDPTNPLLVAKNLSLINGRLDPEMSVSVQIGGSLFKTSIEDTKDTGDLSFKILQDSIIQQDGNLSSTDLNIFSKLSALRAKEEVRQAFSSDNSLGNETGTVIQQGDLNEENRHLSKELDLKFGQLIYPELKVSKELVENWGNLGIEQKQAIIQRYEDENGSLFGLFSDTSHMVTDYEYKELTITGKNFLKGALSAGGSLGIIKDKNGNYYVTGSANGSISTAVGFQNKIVLKPVTIEQGAGNLIIRPEEMTEKKLQDRLSGLGLSFEATGSIKNIKLNLGTGGANTSVGEVSFGGIGVTLSISYTFLIGKLDFFD